MPGEVYDLKLESESKPIGVTGTHPFWSVDRKAWVSAIDLEIGETLKTLAGTTVVESRSKREEPETVYNIEVESDHVYRVGENGLLVHNASSPCDSLPDTFQSKLDCRPSSGWPACPDSRDNPALQSSLGTRPSEGSPQAHHIFPVADFGSDLGIWLCCCGIDLNSEQNGVWLPSCHYTGRTATIHRGSNGPVYLATVRNELRQADSCDEAVAVLDSIKQRLLNDELDINLADPTRPC